MGDRWRVRLEEVADVSWGDTKTTKASYTPSGYPAFSATGPDGFLPYADYSQPGVVISAIGAQCGRSWLARGSWSCIKNTIRILARDDRLDIEFLHWLLQANDIWPKRGSAQPFISQTDARAVWVDLPPLPEQRAIAEVLGALDDKIEANRRIAATVDAFAKAEVEAAQSRADNVLPLGDLLRRVNDIAQPAALDAATVYVGLEHMPRGSIFLTEWGVAEALASAKARFQPGDILFGKLRPYFKKVAVAPSAGVCSTDVLVLRPRHSTQRAFALVVCASDGVINYASAGSRMSRLAWNLGDGPERLS